jgi:hypothetical protein
MSSGSVDIGLIVGCAVGALACLIVVALTVFCVIKRNRKKKGEAQSIGDGVAMTAPASQGIATVYCVAPRVFNQEGVVGVYKSADMNSNYTGLRNVAPTANGQYVDMQMGGSSSSGTFSFPTSEVYSTGQLE